MTLTIMERLANRIDALGSLVWKIPNIDRVGMSHYKIDGAKLVFSDKLFVGHPISQSNWERLGEFLFVSFTGGRSEFEKDFKFLYWRWLRWVIEKENLESELEFVPEFPDLPRPNWLD